MSHELKEGVQLKSVVTLPDPDEGSGLYVVGDLPHQAKEIVVSEQVGHMAMVPWAKVTLNQGGTVLINLANVTSVELA